MAHRCDCPQQPIGLRLLQVLKIDSMPELIENRRQIGREALLVCRGRGARIVPAFDNFLSLAQC